MKELHEIRGLFVGILIGCDVTTAIKQAKQLAKNLDTEIVFNFNGCLLQVDKNSDEDEVYEKFNKYFDK